MYSHLARKSVIRLPALAFAILAAFPALGGNAGAGFREDIQPVLKTYCVRCHGPETRTAGIDFTSMEPAGDVAPHRDVWLRVIRVLREREMPPTAPLPSEAERLAVADWADEALRGIDWSKIRNPGHVVVPRLNRTEYDNTIRDLTGLDLRPARRFPADGAGDSGFDNDRAGLFIPPLLMEKYLDAAHGVAEALIAARRRTERLRTHVEVETMYRTEMNHAVLDHGFDLNSFQQTIYRYVQFPRTGWYTFRVRCWGRSGTEGQMPGLTIRVANEISDRDVVLATESAPEVNTLRGWVPAGNHRVSLHRYIEKTSVTNDAQRELVAIVRRKKEEAKAKGEEKPKIKETQVVLSLDWLEIEEEKSAGSDGSRVFIAEPDAELSTEEAARRILERFATRAYRRPVRGEELKYLLKLFRQAERQGLPFDAAIGRSLKAVLVSPNYLFRVEHKGDAGQRMDDYALASRLSYFLWLSMPDETLFDLASEGRLSEPAVVRVEIRRMMRDPKARVFSSQFAGQWLGSVEVGRGAKPDTGVFPDYSGSLEQSMKIEVVEFFDHLVREDRSLLELIDSDYLILNEELAAHYGMEGVTGREFRKAPVQDRNRGGILGMAGLLTAASLPVRTSPVLRGKWVLETLLGKELPQPPPNAGDLPEPTPETEGLTLRQRFEQHRNSPQCAACHDRIDPIGYGLENYNAIGQWRTADANDQLLDTAGELPSGERFNGPAELKDILLDRKEDFARTVTERMLAFALGRPLAYYDEPSIRAITKAVIESDYRPSVLIEQVALSYPFQYQGGSVTEGASE
jgi:hypothetical protein